MTVAKQTPHGLADIFLPFDGKGHYPWRSFQPEG
jgi:hypothetical protein